MSNSLPIDDGVGGGWRAAAVAGDARPIVVLRPPGSVVTGLLGHLARLPRYWDLLWTLTVHRVRVRYKQSALGWVWAVLQPLMLMLIFTLLFSVTSSRVPTGGVPFTVFAYAAAVPWSFFSTAVGNGTNSLVGQTQLVTKVWFPRELLPLSYVTAALFDFFVASLLLVALMLYHHVVPTWLVLLDVPLVFLMSMLAFAIGVAFAAVQVRYRDVGIAMPLFLQIWMFVSPVMYPYTQVPVRYRWFYQLNPMAGLIEGFRRVTVLGQSPDWHLAGVAAAICLMTLPVCYLYFKYVDATMADKL